MASFTKRGNKWFAQVRMGGLSKSKSFDSKGDARKWATRLEATGLADQGKQSKESKAEIFADLIGYYRCKHLPTVKGKSQEQSRLKIIERALGQLQLDHIKSTVLVQYRERRLKEVGPQTVKHEIGLVLRIMRLAGSEWGYELTVPIIKMPRLPEGRSRRLLHDEEQRLLSALPITVRPMMVFAIETALRRGELCAMRWEHIQWEKKLLLVPETKNGNARTIPLSTRAMAVLSALGNKEYAGRVWRISPEHLSRLFLQSCRAVGVRDLHWHDLRHEATTRLIERGLNLLEASVITGHRDLDCLKRYTHLNPEHLIAKVG